MSVREKEQTVETILNRLFAKEGIKYEITENNFILINPIEMNGNPVNQRAAQEKKHLTGIVTDEKGNRLLERMLWKRNNEWNRYRYRWQILSGSRR